MRFLLASLISGFLCLVAGAADKPNIVYILADDLGINDLSCYRRKDQATPNLDRLAQEGMRFSCAYCAQPICSPSRAAILTGRAPARLHLTTFLPGRPDAVSQKLLHPRMEMQLPLAEQTLAELLKPQGYVSACIGKWHLGGKAFGPEDQGFDVVFGGHPNTPPSDYEGGKGEYELTAKGLEFIEANQEKPFFLYLAHNSPHIPLAAKAKLVEKYASSFNPVYAAMIETLDDTVGLVLAKLEALKLAEKTIVIFTSDNGGLDVYELPKDLNTPSTHNTPYRAGKGFLYEGGLREPLIVRWPGHIKSGSQSDTPVVLADLMPTLLELAGAPIPDNLDYVSIAKLLLGQGELPARDLYWHFPHYSNQGSRPAGAIREGSWKLIEDYEDGHTELYDLAKDVGEMTDLSMKEPARAAAMRGKLAAWRLAVHAQENTPNPNFEIQKAKPLYMELDVSKLALQPTAAAMREKLTEWRAAMDGVVKNVEAESPVGVSAGYIVLHARDAIVHGDALRYEPQPEKNTLGYWKYQSDWASWNFNLAGPGRYLVQLLQGCGAGCGGAKVTVTAGEQNLDFTVVETGHFQNFVPVTIGTLRFGAGDNALIVVPKSKPGAAVMDLRQIMLTKLVD